MRLRIVCFAVSSLAIRPAKGDVPTGNDISMDIGDHDVPIMTEEIPPPTGEVVPG
jgi:hypothetical protein